LQSLQLVRVVALKTAPQYARLAKGRILYKDCPQISDHGRRIDNTCILCESCLQAR
jgi:hypothetical protein